MPGSQDGPQTALTQASPPDRRGRTTYRSVFAVREFRVMAAAMFMYVLGFEFEILGLSVLAFTQTHSAFWTALAFSTEFAPQAVGGALFTSLADRLPPRLVIGAGLLARAAPGLVIGLWPGMPVPAMLALVAAAAATAPVFTAALSGLLPEVLDSDRYVLGRSVFTLIGSATQLAGLGAAGVISSVLPARWLLAAAGTALAANAGLTRLGLRARTARTARADRRRGLVRDTLAGHRELLAHRAVRNLLLAQWLPAWFVAGAESLSGQPGPSARAAPCWPACSAGPAPCSRSAAPSWPTRCWSCATAATATSSPSRPPRTPPSCSRGRRMRPSCCRCRGTPTSGWGGPGTPPS
jgi:MFS family permease